MSWQVNGKGREYHSWEEYQRAKRDTYEIQRRAEEERLQKEINRLNSKRKSLKSSIDAVSGDSQQLQKLSQKLNNHYEELKSVQNHVSQAHQESQLRLDEQFQADSKHMQRRMEVAQQKLAQKKNEMEQATGDLQKQLTQEVQTAQAEFRKLENQSQELKDSLNQNRQELAKNFEKLEETITTNLQAAAQEVTETEQRVAKERQALADQIQEGFYQEMANLNNDADRASAILKQVKKDWEQLQSQNAVNAYGLSAYEKAIEEKMREATQATDPNLCLALAQETYVEMETIRRVQEDRSSQMQAYWEETLQELEGLQQWFPTSATKDKLKQLRANSKEFQKMRREGLLEPTLVICLYFEKEFEQVSLELESLQQEILKEQENPNWFNFEGRTLEQRDRIASLRKNLAEYNDTALSLEKRHRDLRLPTIQRLRQRMKQLMRTRPNLNTVIESQAEQIDEKGNKVLHMEWGNVKYDAYVDIDGQVVDEMGYGFESNKECSQIADAVQQEILEQPRMLSPEVTHENPPQMDAQVEKQIKQMKQQAAKP